MRKTCICIGAVVAAAGAASAQLDGQNIGAGLTLMATQNSPTSFGNAIGGGQDSAGGGELNSMWGGVSGSNMLLSIAGNLEGNFNKAWIFIDSKAGGENTLDGTNTDAGFNEIQNMAGMTFDTGFEADYAIRVEVGPGFYGINFANLQDDTSGGVWGGGGPADLPATDRFGGFGIGHGWDNSNVLGVTDTDASGALTATTGLEFSIPLSEILGGTRNQQTVKVMAIYGNSDATFMSNQVLGGVGLGGTDQLGQPDLINFNQFDGDQFGEIKVPTPGAAALLALGGLVARRRR